MWVEVSANIKLYIRNRSGPCMKEAKSNVTHLKMQTAKNKGKQTTICQHVWVT